MSSYSESLTSGENVSRGTSGRMEVPKPVLWVGLGFAIVSTIVAVVLAIVFSHYNTVFTQQPNLASLMPSRFSGVVKAQLIGSSYPSSPIAWNYDSLSSTNEVIYNYTNPAFAFGYVSYVSNGVPVQVVQSPTGCLHMYMDSTSRGKNYRAYTAVAAVPATQTVEGQLCNAYVAYRYDLSTFNFSINAQGQLCSIGDNGEVYIFQPNAPQPTFQGTSMCSAQTASVAGAPASAVRPVWFWDDIKCDICKVRIILTVVALFLERGHELSDAMFSVQHLAGDAIDAAVDGGCGLLSDGLAVSICNAAINMGCDVENCDQRVCSWIGFC